MRSTMKIGSGLLVLTSGLLWRSSDVSAETPVAHTASRQIGSSGGTSLQLVSHRRSYGLSIGSYRSGHYHSRHHYGHSSYGHHRYGYHSDSYRPSYYGSSFYFGFGLPSRYSYYSYRPRYYGYSYYRPYYYSYGSRGYSYRYRPSLGIAIGSVYFGRSHHLPYDYGGYCCPSVTCCNPCAEPPRCVQPPRDGAQAPQPQPVPDTTKPPTPPDEGSGPSL